MKKRIKLIASAITLSATAVSIGSSLAFNSSYYENTALITTSNQSDTKTDFVPAQSNGQNANISAISGPITFSNNKITALDWYGDEIWQIDMSTYVPEPSEYKNTTSSGYLGSWRRSWFNWDYNRTQNILWVLGYAYNSNQKLFGINATTGKVTYTVDLGNKDTSQNNSPYRFVSALSSGKVMVYGDPSVNYNATCSIVDPETLEVTKITGDSANYLPTTDGPSSTHTYKTQFRWYFFNLIPIANNVNLVEVVAFDAKQSGTKNDESAVNATYNVYGLLVDDNLNFIGNKQGSNSSFREPVLMAVGIQNYRNTTITPQRDYFTLLDSKTVTVLYNNVILFDSSDVNNIKFTQVKMSSNNWIQTWAIDSNDNLYFKFLNDGVIYKIDGSTLKLGKENFSPITYLSLSSVSVDDVKNNANNFLIYNVYGYTGQLMLVNAKYYSYINNYDKENAEPTDNSVTKSGLAVAITPNVNNSSVGDYKGILNGPDSFQKAADFDISSTTLSTKLPSEITEQDIELLNGAFFKSDDPKPFVISNIDDSTGSFTITANLYKIPWFADSLPSDAVPKVVTYTFDGANGKNKAQEIKDKVSWKTLNTSTNYDFLNTLPSKITISDIQNLEPFQTSFQSQVIIDGNNNQLYPNTKYEITSTNDATGEITIKSTYSYVPMNVTYTNGEPKEYTFGSTTVTEKQVLTYSETHTYNVFKSTNQSEFWFTGSSSKSEDNSSQTINISQVPQLKYLLEAGTLPSSFEELNKSSDNSNSIFLPFINTSNSKGYPISKMNFSVSGNDDEGTLTIKATMPASYSSDGKDHSYSVTYTGLNKATNYSFSFNDSVTQINGTDISNILPSAIDEGEIIKNFVSYSGFNSNDFNVSLSPNDEEGSLTVTIKLDSKYADAIGQSNHGFNNYSVTKVINGFMTTSDYNKRYSVSFVSDDSTKLLYLKSMQAEQIVSTFGQDGSKTGSLTVGDKVYTSLKQLIKDLMVESIGSLVPNNWESNNNIKAEVYVDNNLGIATFMVNIPKSEMSGSTSDLNLVVTYSGFVSGNIDKTDDNFSFISNTMLKNYLLSINAFTEEKLNSLTPDEFATWAKSNIEKLITYKTGQYVEKLKNSDYKITTIVNELQNTVTIAIDFGTMTNSQSLSEYSIQYII